MCLISWERTHMKLFRGNFGVKKGLLDGPFLATKSLVYHPFQKHYTHKIIIFEFFRGLQLQLSGVFRINLHYSYSLLVFRAEWSYRK